MPKQSSIRYLPIDMQDYINDELKAGTSSFKTLAEQVNAKLIKKKSDIRVSKSALQRYSKARARLMQSNAAMEMMIQYMGGIPDGKKGRLLLEMTRSLAYDGLEKAVGDGDVNPKLIKEMALTIMRLEKADALNADRETAIREQVMKEASDEVADVAKEAGLSIEKINRVKAKILGTRITPNGS